jgi:hypothetical protein
MKLVSTSCGRLGVAAMMVVALMGCGEATGGPSQRGPPARAPRVGWQTYHNRRWGYDVAFPPGWHRALRSLTPNITDPVEILSLATFPFRAGQSLCSTAGALVRVRPAGALVTIQERGIGAYGGPDFAPRPNRFPARPSAPRALRMAVLCRDATRPTAADVA